MTTKVLFACSKCFSRHPFEELSAGQQLCKDCRGSFAVIKCSYCRTEFQPTSKGTSICRKCEQNIKQFGKPGTCECCNVVAAFGGTKCQRCASSELKYGPPVACDQCKQRCAFDRHDENKKIDGKNLCYLCASSYKRALLKARRSGGDKTSSSQLVKKRPHNNEKQVKEMIPKKSSRNDVAKPVQPEVTDKAPRPAVNSNVNNNIGVGSVGAGLGGGIIAAAAATTVDANNSDHVVAMTQLKEKIAGLQRRLNQKDKELLEKDKQITELKGKNFTAENELRNKMKDSERLYDIKIDLLNKKIASLLKEVASLKKGNKKNGTPASGNSPSFFNNDSRDGTKEKDKDKDKDSGGSGADSPNTN